ncbi:MAG: hypothetical protein IT530_01370 [Burkholderiales bacterium]|nr:hypothetical protein [Burkholderiales bacterium]
MSDAPANPQIVRLIEQTLRKPVYFRDILDATRSYRYRSVLRAWSDVRERLTLERDEYGRYWSGSAISGERVR